MEELEQRIKVLEDENNKLFEINNLLHEANVKLEIENRRLTNPKLFNETTKIEFIEEEV